jgi:hypothetical protein
MFHQRRPVQCSRASIDAPDSVSATGREGPVAKMSRFEGHRLGQGAAVGESDGVFGKSILSLCRPGADHYYIGFRSGVTVTIPVISHPRKKISLLIEAAPMDY